MRQITEIIDFNFAEDIESEWDTYMEDGFSIEDATTQLLEQYSDMLDDDENVLLYITLAIIQVELEQIDNRIKEEVSDMIGTRTLENLLIKHQDNKQLIQKLKRKCR